MSKGISIVGSSRDNGDREENDFYPSPPHTIDDLLRYESFGSVVYEPACGNGAMSKRLEELGKRVVSTDLVYRGYGMGGIDFLSLNNATNQYDAIITNPPYKIGKDFIIKALELTKQNKGKVAMLMKLVFLESADRYNFFKEYPLKKVLVYSKRLSIRKSGEVKKGSGLIAYARFIRDWKYEGNPKIDWIF